jgi:hypothetical protein
MSRIRGAGVLRVWGLRGGQCIETHKMNEHEGGARGPERRQDRQRDSPDGREWLHDEQGADHHPGPTRRNDPRRGLLDRHIDLRAQLIGCALQVIGPFPPRLKPMA